MGKPEEAELASILDIPDATVEQKLEALRSAFLEKASSLRKSAQQVEDANARAGVARIQRDALKADFDKVVAVKDKLEVLCRELQKANKTVIADARAAAVAEAEKRDELSKQFESGLGDISSKLEAHSEERAASLRENEELREHLRKLVERSDLQEAHFDKAKQTFDLEKQLYEARLAESAEKFAASEAHRDALAKQCGARGEGGGAPGTTRGVRGQVRRVPGGDSVVQRNVRELQAGHGGTVQATARGGDEAGRARDENRPRATSP